MEMCLKEPNFLEKSPSGKNGQNRLKYEVFGLFRNISSLVLYGNDVRKI